MVWRLGVGYFCSMDFREIVSTTYLKWFLDSDERSERTCAETRCRPLQIFCAEFYDHFGGWRLHRYSYDLDLSLNICAPWQLNCSCECLVLATDDLTQRRLDLPDKIRTFIVGIYDLKANFLVYFKLVEDFDRSYKLRVQVVLDDFCGCYKLPRCLVHLAEEDTDLWIGLWESVKIL